MNQSKNSSSIKKQELTTNKKQKLDSDKRQRSISSKKINNKKINNKKRPWETIDTYNPRYVNFPILRHGRIFTTDRVLSRICKISSIKDEVKQIISLGFPIISEMEQDFYHPLLYESVQEIFRNIIKSKDKVSDRDAKINIDDKSTKSKDKDNKDKDNKDKDNKDKKLTEEKNQILKSINEIAIKIRYIYDSRFAEQSSREDIYELKTQGRDLTYNIITRNKTVALTKLVLDQLFNNLSIRPSDILSWLLIAEGCYNSFSELRKVIIYVGIFDPIWEKWCTLTSADVEKKRRVLCALMYFLHIASIESSIKLWLSCQINELYSFSYYNTNFVDYFKVDCVPGISMSQYGSIIDDCLGNILLVDLIYMIVLYLPLPNYNYKFALVNNKVY